MQALVPGTIRLAGHVSISLRRRHEAASRVHFLRTVQLVSLLERTSSLRDGEPPAPTVSRGRKAGLPYESPQRSLALRDRRRRRGKEGRSGAVLRGVPVDTHDE